MSPPKTTPRERPILFSDAMVRAILDGRKTVTRRVVKPMSGKQSEWLDADLIAQVPHGEMIDGGWQMHHPKAGTRWMGVDTEYDSPLGWVRCPYGAPGDRLYVREAFQRLKTPNGRRVIYRADAVVEEALLVEVFGGWRPSIHLPREGCRLLLDVVSVRVERLREITEEDARREGFAPVYGMGDRIVTRTSSWSFVQAWDALNAKRPGASWADNPWVWRVEFRRAAP